MHVVLGKFEDTALPSGPRGFLFRRLLPKIQDLLVALREIGKAHDKSATQVAINWCMCKGTIPIPGVKNLDQATENLGAIGWHLTESEVSDLDIFAERTDGKMVQNIFQTK